VKRALKLVGILAEGGRSGARIQGEVAEHAGELGIELCDIAGEIEEVAARTKRQRALCEELRHATSETLSGNRVIADGINRAARQIADGASISAGFASTGLFPPLVIRMLRVGENTGGLDTSLLNIAYFYNRDVEESMARMQQMIMPVMTVMIGAVIIWVIVSVYGPIYDLITKVGV
jgi:hypothetical protein